ncbi:MAG: efflux RND transporter periplasmic adaptor subunit [Candidatus Rokubacteria bacterium]|nr:efflux RND transporter periplasmic adaptor subunit [Candidatus Rokubacteria bacterium]
MSRRSRRGAAAALIALATLAGCSRAERDVATKPPQAPAPQVVRVDAATLRAVPLVVEPVGTVRARAQSVLSSRIVAAVVGVHVREGQRVRAGDLVVTLDDRDLSADLRRATAAAREAREALEEVRRATAASARAIEAASAQDELATSTLRRYRGLLDRELIAPQQYDEVSARARAAAADLAGLRETHAALGAKREQALARIEQADADLARSRVGGDHARLLAPMDGIVVTRSVEVGNMAAPGVPLVAIETERYRLEVNVEESELGRVRLGQQTPVVIEALGLQRSGTVEEIVPAADPASRTFLVKIDLGADPGLRSGLYGRARFVVGERRTLVVPRAAVVDRGQLRSVFVVDGAATARLRLVTTGRAWDGGVEVLSGLAEGDRVVVEGAERLVDGAALEPRA